MKPIHFFGGTLALLILSAGTTLTQSMAQNFGITRTGEQSLDSNAAFPGSTTASVGHLKLAL